MKTSNIKNNEQSISDNTKKPTSSIIITNIENRQHFISHEKFISVIFPSELIIQNALEQILYQVHEKAYENNCVRKKMAKFSGKFAQSYTEEISRMHLDICKLKQIFSDDNEPHPLRTDNLIPVGTNIQQNHSDRVSLYSSIPETTLLRFPRNQTIVSRGEKQLPLTQSDFKITPKVAPYVKLNEQDLPKYEVSSDPLVQEMRRQKELKLKESHENKKVQKKTIQRDIIKKDEKISYDFTGQIIKINSKQKGNFATNSVEGLQNSTLTKKEKQPKIDINPVNLDINARKNIDKKALSKKTIDVEFSNIVSLTPQLQIHEGIKFIHGKSILEKKKKQASISELKKTISTKRFSRNDFERLRSLGDNKSVSVKGDSPSLPIILKSSTDTNIDRNDSILGRSVSEAKFEDSSRFSLKNRQLLLNKSQDKMSIENEELTEILLEPVHNSLEDNMILKMPQNQKNQGSKVIVLNHIDQGNLNFIKTGSVGKIQLPKISYRINTNSVLKQSHPVNLLQSKTKMKGKRKQNQFERLRKHFQDKLRT